MRITILFVALVAIILSALDVSANDVDLVLEVEKSLDGGKTWTPRGKLKYVVNKQEKKLSVKFEQPTFTFTKQEVQTLKTSWLSVRIPAVESNGQIVPAVHLVTSTHGCAIVQDPKEVFSLLTDKTGALIALQYDRPLVPDCSNAAETKGDELEVASKIVAVLPKEGASVPAPQKMNLDSLVKEEAAQKEQQAPQGFFQQYWYIIMPAVLVYTLLTAPQGPDDQPAGAAQGAVAAGAAAGAAVAGSAGGAGSVRKRK